MTRPLSKKIPDVPEINVFVGLHVVTDGDDFNEADVEFIKKGFNRFSYDLSYLHILADNYNSTAIGRYKRTYTNYIIDDEVRHNPNLQIVSGETTYPIYWKPITPQQKFKQRD